MPPNKNETERDGQKLHSSQLILADEVKQIARRLKKLRKMCADPEKRKLIEIKPIVKTMESLAEHLVGDISYLFETIFIKHMEIVMDLFTYTELDYKVEFRWFTKLMCKLVSTAGLSKKFLKHMFKMWSRCLEPISSELKYQVLCKIDRVLAGNVFRFLIETTSFSMQIKMLDVICSYLHGEHLEGIDLLAKSFVFISLLEKCVTLTKEVENGVVNMLKTKDVLRFEDKQQLLALINQCSKDSAIMSIPIQSLTPDFLNAEKKKKNHSGWMHFNRMINNIEIWLQTESQPAIVTIKPKHLQSIHMKKYDNCPKIEVFLKLNSPPKYKTAAEKVIEPFGNCIAITFSEVPKNDLSSVFGQMFPGINCQTVTVKVLQHFTIEQQGSTIYENNSLEIVQDGSFPLIEEFGIDEYEFNDPDDEPLPKKRRRIKQPTKRTKPAAFPRIQMPEKPKRNKPFTVGRKKKPTTLQKNGGSKNKRTSGHTKILDNLARINQMFKAPSSTITINVIQPPICPRGTSNGLNIPRQLYTNHSTEID